MNIKPNKYPVDVTGSDLMSDLLLTLLNTFPGLQGQKIKFSTLSDTEGIGLFPTAGAAIISNRESVTGHVNQSCAYTFTVVYRAAPKTEERRLKIKEWLDLLGKWLEQQTVNINEEDHKIKDYPPTNDSREIEDISRTSSAHLDKVYQDGIEDWVITATLHYKNEFDK